MKNNKHHKVPKGWGEETWLVNKQQYCGKLLKFNKDKKCSVHYHILKDETFYLHSGKVLMKYWDIPKDRDASEWLNDFDLVGKTVELNPGDTFYVPPYRVHQVTALENSEVFEFSSEHFDTDSLRLRKGD